jgi:hypothetical protein
LLITQVIVDPGSVRIVAWDIAGSLDIRLGSAFVYSEPDGRERTMDPEHPEQLAPLLTVVNRSLERATILRTGALLLRLGDGSSIRCDPDAHFEAWEARGVGALEAAAYLCNPGGGSPWGAA